MNIRHYSGQFTIYIFMDDVDLGATLKVTLAKAGYDAYYIQSQKELEGKINENPCHILLLYPDQLKEEFSEFLEKINQINSEINFITINSPDKIEILTQYADYGLLDMVIDLPTFLEARVLWSIDHACEKIYLTLQNEQLLAELSQEQSHKHEKVNNETHSTHEGAAAPTKKLNSNEGNGIFVAATIGEYRLTTSQEELVQKFVSSVKSVNCIFFKYLPSVQSLIATHANIIEPTTLKGVGCKFSQEESRNLSSTMALGHIPDSMKILLRQGFKFQAGKILPIFVQSQLEGVLAYQTIDESQPIQNFHESFALFALAYSHYCLEKRIDSLEVQDYVTEIYNRSYYFRRLENSIETAKKQLRAVSICKFAIDQLDTIQTSMGEATRDLVLKTVATMINKECVGSDFCARTGSNEITFVLFNCSRKSASLRAEKLRKIIEKDNWLDNGLKITVSVGISEFPTLSPTAEASDESATKALQHIYLKGGNKLCLFKANPSYQPEFKIAEDFSDGRNLPPNNC